MIDFVKDMQERINRQPFWGHMLKDQEEHTQAYTHSVQP